MAYVYKHIRKDNNEIFYIGISDDKTYNRAYCKKYRNRYWSFIVNKVGYEVEILYDNLTWEQACKKEIQLIKFYGRSDLKEGSLVNMTDGGEGLSHPSEETKAKIRNYNLIYGKKGEDHWTKNMTEEQRSRMSKKVKGNKNPACRPEIKEKIRQKAIGRKPKPETLEKYKQRIGDKNGFYNKHHSEETMKHLKEKAKGRYSLEWFIHRHGEIEGTIKYEERRVMIKQSMSNMKPMQRAESICPHCKLVGKGPNMKRYHFDNCKTLKR